MLLALVDMAHPKEQEAVQRTNLGITGSHDPRNML